MARPTLPTRLPAACCLLALLAASPLAAQDTTAVVPDSAAPAPAGAEATAVIRGRGSPEGAMLRSFLLPGWGQLHVGRKLTAAVFVTAEVVTLGMALKANADLRDLERTGGEGLEDARNSREDWFVLWGFNHLLSGLEAFVGGHLREFPDDLRIRRVPGGVGATLTLPPVR